MKSITEPKKERPGLLGIEKISIIYGLLTGVAAIVLNHVMPDWEMMMLARVMIVAGLAALLYFYHKKPCRLTFGLRVCYQLLLILYWYPETYLFCRIIGNFDHIFATADQIIFGCQPALIFSQYVNSPVWKELFYMGYFSYYIIIIFIVTWTFFKHYERFEKATFIVLCSFLIYYLVFILVPVAGPQYYFAAIGVKNASIGVFPSVGHYFTDHTATMAPLPDGGVFQSIVEFLQRGGERPTAAFPSSHVGVATVVMILAWKNNHKSIWWLMPFYLLLCVATVYIRAHYAVDAIAGLLTGFPIYYISRKIYYMHFFHRRHGYHA